MRLFIAIGVPEDIKEYLCKIQEKIHDGDAKIRFAKKEQMHLTLKFLGEVQPNNIEEIKKELREVEFNPFSVYLSGVGVFPSEDYIRVVWAGLKPEDKILDMQKNIDEKLKKLFGKEKNFRAHVTLARVKFVDNKKEFVDKLKTIKIENKRFDVNNFNLVKSTLSPKGAVYETIGTFGP